MVNSLLWFWRSHYECRCAVHFVIIFLILKQDKHFTCDPEIQQLIVQVIFTGRECFQQCLLICSFPTHPQLLPPPTPAPSTLIERAFEYTVPRTWKALLFCFYFYKESYVFSHDCYSANGWGFGEGVIPVPLPTRKLLHNATGFPPVPPTRRTSQEDLPPQTPSSTHQSPFGSDGPGGLPPNGRFSCFWYLSCNLTSCSVAHD